MLTKQIGFLLIVVCITTSSCRLVKLGNLFLSKNHRKPSFYKQIIKNNPDSVFHFSKGTAQDSLLIANVSFTLVKKEEEEAFNNLEAYLKKLKTTAFLVLKKDTILFEKYYKNNDDSSIFPSFSIAKSFTAALTGLAIQEGYIKSVDNAITDYLPELKKWHPNWATLKIKHLLEMRSGIKVSNLKKDYEKPYSKANDLLMDKDIMKVIKDGNYIPNPSYRDFNYSNLDAQLLGLVLEKAVNRPLSVYLEEKIWKPLGMEGTAKWALDSKKNRNTKTFCCMQARARDFAKFALLYLQQGNWQGEQLIKQDWVLKSYPQNNSYMDNYWWRTYNSLIAQGTFGQEIILFPKEEIIILRFGVRKYKRYETYLSPDFKNALFKAINTIVNE